LASLIDSRCDGRKAQRRMTVRETIEEVIVSYAVRARAGPEDEQRSPAVPEKILEAALPAAVEQWEKKTWHQLANVLGLHSADPRATGVRNSPSGHDRIAGRALLVLRDLLIEHPVDGGHGPLGGFRAALDQLIRPV